MLPKLYPQCLEQDMACSRHTIAVERIDCRLNYCPYVEYFVFWGYFILNKEFTPQD